MLPQSWAAGSGHRRGEVTAGMDNQGRSGWRAVQLYLCWYCWLTQAEPTWSSLTAILLLGKRYRGEFTSCSYRWLIAKWLWRLSYPTPCNCVHLRILSCSSHSPSKRTTHRCDWKPEKKSHCAGGMANAPVLHPGLTKPVLYITLNVLECWDLGLVLRFQPHLVTDASWGTKLCTSLKLHQVIMSLWLLT